MSLLYCKNMVMGRGKAFWEQFIDYNRIFLTRMRSRLSLGWWLYPGRGEAFGRQFIDL